MGDSAQAGGVGELIEEHVVDNGDCVWRVSYRGDKVLLATWRQHEHVFMRLDYREANDLATALGRRGVNTVVDTHQTTCPDTTGGPSASPSIPVNHQVVGTCGKCGGPIISPVFTDDWANGSYRDYAPAWCSACGAIPKKEIRPDYGPVREML